MQKPNTEYNHFEFVSHTTSEGRYPHFLLGTCVGRGPLEELDQDPVCVEDLGGRVVCTWEPTLDICSDAEVQSRTCQLHAQLIAAELKMTRSQEKRLKDAFAVSMEQLITRLSGSVVFSVAFLGSRVISVRATQGVGVENCWWHAGMFPMGHTKSQQLFRFSSTVEGLEARTTDVAQRLALDSNQLLKLSKAALGDLAERTSA